MTKKIDNWYRREIAAKEKAVRQSERELQVAELALAKVQAELAYYKGQLEFYQKMADLTDEEDEAFEKAVQQEKPAAMLEILEAA